ncbi:hypothetical protein GCM10011357_04130 [Lacimicrobium alkaliphilum]|uniref:DUF1343 domain-containing protein n=2 Tax=Lacimicrobium alkaliphilum TaxID=1526571 RepID=A0ABQ1QY06_9ALTE|nr:hypothetical protein GCM10011357_04130 [Lacimicrobium alkaliphilum]
MPVWVLFTLATLLFGCSENSATTPIKTGAEQTQVYLPLLRGKAVGLVVNQTSMVGEQHLVDLLMGNQINVQRIFAPEHGFRGDHDAGAKVDSGRDRKTGIELYSIYGKTRKPAAEAIADLDVIVFDIQDVGVRFYTYISSMHYMMEAAAEADIPFVVLDRPNPNGDYTDGPVLDPQFQSFVGMHPIPLVHGMTVGELAQMIKAEGWLETERTLDLTVVPVAGYHHDLRYELPVKPSPNLPNFSAIRHYPSLAFFEPTVVSIGRGTDFPFQVIGHDSVYLTEGEAFRYTPRSIPGASTHPKFENTEIKGMDLRDKTAQGLNLEYLLAWHQAFVRQQQPFFTSESFFDKLAGTDKLRKAMAEGKTQAQIRASWQADLEAFIKAREPYLLYP